MLQRRFWQTDLRCGCNDRTSTRVDRESEPLRIDFRDDLLWPDSQLLLAKSGERASECVTSVF